MAKTVAVLTLLGIVGLSWLQGGGLLHCRPAADDWKLKRFGHIRAQSRRLSCEDPLSFGGDKRGRCEALFQELVDGKTSHNRHSDRAATWWYKSPQSSRTALPFVADRLGLPLSAASIPLDRYLHPVLAAEFDAPEAADAKIEDAPPGSSRWRCMSGGELPGGWCDVGWLSPLSQMQAIRA